MTPSPKRESNASQAHTHGYEPGDQHSSSLMRGHQNRSQNEMSIADQSGINVEPMFGNDYGQEGRKEYNKRINALEAESNTDGFRGMTSKSSQRTLRYNDFELVAKEAQDDPAYAVDLDEGDNKDTPRESSAEDANRSVQYPDRMQKLYESKNHLQSFKSTPFQANSNNNMRSSGSFLPKMGLNHSIEQQRRDEKLRKHLNSNDTQLASHTINLNASQHQQNSPNPQGKRHVFLPNRAVQRSLPPTNSHNSKISVKPNISLVGGAASRTGVGTVKNQHLVSPKMQNTRIKSLRPQRRNNQGGEGSGSRGRFDFAAPYAQNLRRPKLYEARGT